MALQNTLEIYIPVEADVNSILLSSLPNSIQRRMGLPRSDSNCIQKAKGTWICPAVIRRKGRQVVSDTGNDVKEEFLSLMGRESQAKSDPYRLSFVSSNRKAYEVLKATKHRSTVSADTSHTSLQCQALPPQAGQDAVVVYNGQVYLSLRNPHRRQNEKKTCNTKMVSQSFAPSSLDSSSDIQKKVFPYNTATNKQITCKVTQSEKTKGSYVSSAMNAQSVPECTDSVHRQNAQDARAEQTVEDVADLQPDRSEPLGEEVANRVCDEYEETDDLDHTSAMDYFISPRSPSKDPLGTAKFLQKECDFNELEQEETIARMKASLKEKQDALSRLSS